jgi:hypothetical protein
VSDYLWDKSGEADPEVERLENLLGQLRYQPTPFDLPRELPRPATLRAAHRSTIFSRPRLALAASVALALLLGAWLVSNRQTRTNEEMAGGNRPSDAKQQQQPAAVAQTTDGGVENKGGVEESGEGGGVEESGVENGAAVEKRAGEKTVSPQAAPKSSPRRLPRVSPKRRVMEDAALPPKPRLPLVASRGGRRDARPEAASRTPGEFIASNGAGRQYTREQIEAAEKLLYALRVTSEKLSYAQRQVQGVGRGDEPRR